ncbi:MAG: nitrilase-related carbon-nitrogen hydrolase [Thermoplasmata archaeon]
MRILLAQCASTVGDIEKNMAKLDSVFSKSDADLTIFPELFVSGYIPRDSLSALAEPIDGPTVSKLVDMCRESGKALITGIPLTHPSVTGQITNSAVAIDKHGKVGRYDKSYLPTFGPFEENLYFTPGASKLLLDISGIKIGVVICYDLFFPELTRLLALQGADMIACISASPTATVINFKRMIPARAIENATYVAYVNLVGLHLDLVFGGESRAVDPRGELLAEAKPLEEELVYCDIDISKLEFARRMRPTLRDCRREVFEAILDLKKYE